MKSREFKKIYHPKMGRFVYQHRGNGIIVDNIMKPVKKIASALAGKVVKPFAEKAIQAGVSQAGEKVGKKAADKVIERSGELIRKRLSSKNAKKPKATPQKQQRRVRTADEVNTLINNLIARS